MKQVLLFLTTLLCLAACSPKIQYIGKSYRSTSDVDIFFDKNDIKKDYEVMGKVDGTGGIVYSSFDDIQSEMVKVAKKKGADGIIVYNMEQRVIGNNANTDTKVDSSTPDAFGQSTTVKTSTSSNTITQNALKADFIKYR